MSKVRKFAAMALCTLALATLWAGAALAGSRMALVIGNSAYRNAGTLPNTINDAAAVAGLFRKIGFDVVDERHDVEVVEFKRVVREFMAAAQNADVAVVYYSGHGMEVGGNNFLIPIDAKLAADYDAEDEAVSLDRIIQAVQSAKRLRLIILDACRDNPFLHAGKRAEISRDIVKGLAPIDPSGADTLIAYAAKAGSVSYDGTGKNSPFTAALVKYLAEPGLDIRLALGRVRDDVQEQTGHRQEPFIYGSLGGTLVSLVAAPEPTKEAAVDPNVVLLREYEVAERVGTRQAWESFLALHDTGFYATLAREQLTKLAPPKPAVAPPEPVVAVAPPKPDVTSVEPKVAVLPPPPPPHVEVEATPDASPEVCRAEEVRLAGLRANPAAAEVAKFARELSCRALRPQVTRLLESLGVDPTVTNAPQQTASLETPETARQVATPPGSAPTASGQDCKLEQERLAQLRGRPVRDEVVAFARTFRCEELRPQVNRLLESFGLSRLEASRSVSEGADPTGAAPRVERHVVVATPKPPAATDAVHQQQACERDKQTLIRLRAGPTAPEVARFMRELSCEELRPQAARLLDSVGE